MATMVTGTSAAATPADVASSEGPRESLPRRVGRFLWRWQLAVVCAGFLLLALLQAPGEIVGDTKSDLVVDPLAFLGRALTLWEPEGAAGQIQNQAYGYFFPMGPFFALGQLAGIPAWIVQRLWFAALMSVAFLGLVILARRLRIGTPATVLVAGIAYALSPRMVTAIGALSIETIPLALAPWVLIPLVGAQQRGSARRAAALSGLAVFCVGGVNAVATAAVLPLAVLYLLTRPSGPFKRRLITWWVVAVGLATAWWAGPLVLLGRFGSSFLYYIETAEATTGPTDVLSVLRGTTHWLGSLASPAGPNWPAGWSLLRDAGPVAATVVLAAAGLAALCRRDLPERTWLVLGLLAGVGLVSLGHLAEVQGLLAERLHDALDGPLAPLRNVHKWDPVVRLPLVLGLAHIAGVAVGRVQRARADRTAPRTRGRAAGTVASRAVLVALAVALVASVSPALAGRLAPPTGFADVPGYWEETADFLAAQQPSGRALLVPGSSFPQYEWGTPIDEPMQALAESPWDVRNAIPLTPEGHIRMLDAIEARLTVGEGSEGLTRYLARAGISHLVLRNDLDTGAAGSTRSALVRQALGQSPGIQQIASFGPVSAADDVRDGFVVDAGLDEPAPAIEVYSVTDVVPTAWTTPLSEVVTVHGGPEAVLALEERGLVTDRPTLMAGTPGAPATPLMVSDALVRRERNYGRLLGATSAGLSDADALRMDNPARDYVIPALDAAESVISYLGGTPTASSSASDPDYFTPSQVGTQPWAAVDGDPTTAWRPAPWDGSGEPPWWRLTTDLRTAASEIIVSLGQEPGVGRPSELRITTDAGELVVPVADTGEEQTLPLPEGYTSQITIASTVPADAPGAPSLSLADVRVPGLNVFRTTVTPPAGPASVFAFDALRGRSGCVTGTDDASLCAPGLVSGAEEAMWMDRGFTTPNWLDYELFATAVARPGRAFDALLARLRGTAVVEASSEAVTDHRGSAAAALDGDPTTAWVAGGDDLRPTLELTWPEPRTVDSLRVVTAAGLAAATPTAVSVDAGGLPRTVRLGEDGTATFAPVVTDRLTVSFLLPDEVESLDPYTRWETRLGVGVSELEIGGPNPVTDPETPVILECGSGPEVRLDGAVMATTVRTTLGRLESRSPMALEFCDALPTVRVPAGEHRLRARSSDVLDIDSATLLRVGWPDDFDSGVRTAARTTDWEAERRAVEVDARSEDTLLVIPENTNPGWRATLDGQALGPVAVDGWQQGYIVPAGPAGTVELAFRPGPYYRAALAVGAVAVLLLVLVAVLPARPARERPSRAARRWTTLPAALSAALVTGSVAVAALFGTALVAGLVGLGALVGLWLLSQLVPRTAPALLGAVAVGALAGAGALLLVDADGTEGPQQLLAVVALAAVVAGVLPGLPRRWLQFRRGTPGPAVPGP
jgi:arabinofuranan 3-O-arabinosyltransferase